MKVLSLLAAVLASVDAQAISASKACVTNSGGYVLYWWYQDLVNGNKSSESDHYPIDQTKCMDMTIQGLNTGDFVEVYVHAVAGVTKSANQPLLYDPSGPIVTFTCNGTTLNFQCKANGYMEESLQ